MIFAKLRSPLAMPEPPARATPPEAPEVRGHGGLFVPILLLVIGAGVLWVRFRSTAPAAPPEAAAAPAPAQTTAELELPPPLVARTPPPLALAPVESADVPDAEREAANALLARLNAHAPLGSPDVKAAEDLYARHPGEPVLRDILGGVHLWVGAGEQAQRRFGEAAGHFRRAAAVLPQNAAPRLLLLGLLLSTGDWSGAEAAARDVLDLDPTNIEALNGLGFALYRQDRNRDAADALRKSLGIRETAEARVLLARIEKGMADERGMTEQRISHFNVRYNGDAHEDVGREILRALERHYATLVGTLDHQPQATIAVILFSQEQYYDASGAPAWSGGAYDNIDGRIRVPIGGLTTSLTPDMDQVLVHEVTHAFIADRTRGLAPRDIHEGLAQYVEGKRLASLLSADQLRTLADGRARGVMGFYLQALSFVEYLIAIRGQGGMNDLLKAMGETGNVDGAFRQVYGQGYAATQAAWIERLRQQYGS